MEDWLSQLEMAWNDEPILNNNNNMNEQYYDQNQEIDALGEELAVVLGEDFSFLPAEDQTSLSSLLDYNCPSQNNTNLNNTNLLLSDQSIFDDDHPQPVAPLSDNNVVLPHNHGDNDNNNDNDSTPKSIAPIIANSNQPDVLVVKDQSPVTNNNSEEQVPKSGRKRRRDPEQVHCHIIAERKRRELLTQRFIALSAMVPGLKKVDKTSVLEEAIKYLGKMQERVKALEEATSKQNVGPVMVVKRRQLVLDDNNDDVSDSSTVTSTDDTTSGNSDGHQSGTLPEIEAKVSQKTLLLRICCVRRKGLLAKIYQEVENFQMTILNASVVAFEDSTLDITILTQMEAGQGYDKHVKDLVRSLNSALRSTS